MGGGLNQPALLGAAHVVRVGLEALVVLSELGATFEPGGLRRPRLRTARKSVGLTKNNRVLGSRSGPSPPSKAAATPGRQRHRGL